MNVTNTQFKTADIYPIHFTFKGKYPITQKPYLFLCWSLHFVTALTHIVTLLYCFWICLSLNYNLHCLPQWYEISFSSKAVI